MECQEQKLLDSGLEPFGGAKPRSGLPVSKPTPSDREVEGLTEPPPYLIPGGNDGLGINVKKCWIRCTSTIEHGKMSIETRV